jgi:phenylacetate-CoA ligase
MYVVRQVANLAGKWRAQFADPAVTKEKQAGALRDIVAHAYATVPLYRDRFDAAGIRPRDVLSIADLAALPVVTRQELEATEIGRRVSSAFDASSLRTIRTSGSSGRPLTIHRDPAMAIHRKPQFIRGMAAAGYMPGMPVLMFARRPRRGESVLLRWRRAGRDSPPEEHLAAYRAMRPPFAYGFVTPLRRVALLLREERERHCVRAVFTTGETLDTATRRLLEEAFGGPVFEIYGSAEFGTVAWECRRHEGLHVGEDVVIHELLPLAGSDASRLVLTSLTNRAVPLIRYEIGDLAAAGPAERCACGRTFVRLARVEGRMIDCLRRPDGVLVAPYAVEAAVEKVPGVTRFQVVQEEAARVVVRLEGAPDGAVADGVAAALEPLLGPMRVEAAFLEDLEPAPGRKFRLVQYLAGVSAEDRQAILGAGGSA